MTLKLVVENDQKTVDRKMALGHVSWPLREMAANLLRVMAGAGRPHEIGRNLVGVLDGYAKFRELVGSYPSSEELQSILDFLDDSDMDHSDVRDAQDDIVQGALRTVASRLLGQTPQERAGNRLMLAGVNQIEAIRAADRARNQAERAAWKKSQKKAGAKSRKKKPAVIVL